MKIYHFLSGRVQKRKCGSKRKEITGGWRNFQNEELHSLYSVSDIVRVNRSKKLRWAVQIARTGKNRSAYSVWVEIKKPFRL